MSKSKQVHQYLSSNLRPNPSPKNVTSIQVLTFAKIRVQKCNQYPNPNLPQNPSSKIITTVHVSQTTTKPLSTPNQPRAVHYMGRCLSFLTVVLCEVRAKHEPMRDGHTPVPEDSISYSAVTATKCPSRSNRMVHFGSHLEGTQSTVMARKVCFGQFIL